MVEGLAIGACYGLFAAAVVIIYKTSEVVNFAQGEMAMFSSFVAFHILTVYQYPFWLAFVISMVFSVLLGVLIEYLFLRPAKHPSILGLLVITLGAEMFLMGLAAWKWGAEQKFFSLPLDPSVTYEPVKGMIVNNWAIAVFLSAGSLMLLLYGFFKYTETRRGHAGNAAEQLRRQDHGDPDRTGVLHRLGIQFHHRRHGGDVLCLPGNPRPGVHDGTVPACLCRRCPGRPHEHSRSHHRRRTHGFDRELLRVLLASLEADCGLHRDHHRALRTTERTLCKAFREKGIGDNRSSPAIARSPLSDWGCKRCSKKEEDMTVTGKVLVSCIAVMAALSVATLVQAAPPPGFDDKEIRIAQWGPQTGPAAPWGSVARGSKLLFDVVNEEGGINGRKIRYFIRDDMYNPAQTAAAVKELVERQGIFAFVGGVGSAPGMAVKDYLAANKILWVGPSAADKDFVVPLNPYLFAVYPLYKDEGSILAKYIVDKLNMKKIGILYQNDAYGKDGLEGVKDRLATYKISLVAEIPVEPTEKDLASQILRLRNSGAETVIMFVNPTAAVIALKTSANVGFKPQWVSSNTLSDYPLMLKGSSFINDISVCCVSGNRPGH